MTSPDTFDAEGYLDAVAPTMGLRITPTQRPGVVAFLRVAEGMARLLDRAPVDRDAIEPAPVFCPGTPAQHR